MNSSKIRVLLLADSANPESSSVSLIGWSLAQALSRHVDAHLVTREQNTSVIERSGWRRGTEFSVVDPSRVDRHVSRFGNAVQKATGLGWTFNTALATIPYAHFERLVWRRFGRQIEQKEFDVVHRIVPVSPTIPSSIAARCKAAGVPFILGPLNGGVPWPKEFRSALRREGEWLTYLRAAHRLVPGYKAARDASAALLAGSTHVWGELEAWRDRCVYVPENAVDPDRISAERPPPGEGPLRVAFVGRLVPYKGADMLIEAAAPLVRSGRLSVDIIGDGPEMANLRSQVDREHIAGGVTFAGWIPNQRDVAPRLARADVFGFPSIREFGGGAVLEAMALGLVPVIADYAGPSELVTDETGYRVPMGPRASLVAGFRNVLEELADHPARARAIGARARERVMRLFTWDVKARQIVDVYEWALGQRGKPDFGMPFPEPDEATPSVESRVAAGMS